MPSPGLAVSQQQQQQQQNAKVSKLGVVWLSSNYSGTLQLQFCNVYIKKIKLRNSK
jgi:hypothetical protein